MRKKEWDEIKRRADRVLSNGTTSGSARALAKDVLNLIAEIEYRRNKMAEYEDLLRRQLAVLEDRLPTGDDLAAALTEFLREQEGR